MSKVNIKKLKAFYTKSKDYVVVIRPDNRYGVIKYEDYLNKETFNAFLNFMSECGPCWGNLKHFPANERVYFMF